MHGHEVTFDRACRGGLWGDRRAQHDHPRPPWPPHPAPAPTGTRRQPQMEASSCKRIGKPLTFFIAWRSRHPFFGSSSPFTFCSCAPGFVSARHGLVGGGFTPVAQHGHEEGRVCVCILPF